jgi:acyl carrier protein
MSALEQHSWTRDRLKADVLDILREKVERSDSGFSGALTEETRLFRDLGFESITLVEFCRAVGNHFQRKLPFQSLVFRDGRFQDFTVGELVTFLEEHLPG